MVCVVVVALVGVLSVLAVSPPSVVGESAAATEFSAARAYHHVEAIGQQVHPSGSAAQTQVQAYIETTLRGLGLAPEIRTGVGGTGKLGGPYGMAAVNNIVAVIPGTSSTGRLFLVAHQDSVQVSYGANDDGAGVASLLETARALKAGPALRNEVVLVFTDAEEACLCGAEAFVSSDPLARDGGVVLNLESRGSSGPAIMFETSRGNGNLISRYAAAAPHPVATSFAVEVYRILPNDTDFTEFRESGRFSGLNTAYIDGSGTYHSPEDRPDYMDERSLQDLGENTLAVTRGLGGADLKNLADTSGSDATYFPALGLLIRYPGGLVWPFAVLALVLSLGLGFLARRRGESSIGRSAAGFGLAAVPLVVSAALAQAFWFVLTLLRSGYANMIDPWRPGWYRVALIVLVVAVELGWFCWLRRRFGLWSLFVGSLLLLSVLGLVLAGITPGGSYLAALPAGVGALTGIGALLVRDVRARAALFGVGGAAGLVVLAPTVSLFFPALGLTTGAAPAFFAAMAGLTLLPLADLLLPDRDGPRRRWSIVAPVAPLLLVALILTDVGLLTDKFDAAHPQPVQLGYALDTDTGKAFWVSDTHSTGAWIAGYVGPVTADISDSFGLFSGTVRIGTAPAAPLSAPQVSVLSDTTSGGQRHLSLRVTPQRRVRLVYLGETAVPVASATIDGRQVPTVQLAHGLSVAFNAPPGAGLIVDLVLAGTAKVPLRVMDGSDGLTGLPGYTPRPVGVGVKGSHTAEMVVVAATRMI